MKITDVRTAVVEANYEWTFVRVYTDDGPVGLGESFVAPGLPAIIADLAPLLIGEDPLDIERLWSKMRWATSGPGSIGGIVWNAISGIEAALWDLAGRHYGMPIYRLLGGGGKYRDRVRMYADCHAGEALEALTNVYIPRVPSWIEAGDDSQSAAHTAEVGHPVHGRAFGAPRPREVFTPQMYAQRAREVVAQGFTALKFDLDVPNPYSHDPHSGTLTHAEIAFTTSLVRAVRHAVGDSIEIAFDCHWRYNVSDAQRLARALEPYGLAWLEDPVPPEDVGAHRQVTQSTSTPIGGGENWYLSHGFSEALETDALDVIAPDPQKVGGLAETRRIAAMADTHYRAVAPHCIASPIGTIAAVHVAATIPNLLTLEWHGMEVPFWDELATGLDGPLIRDGHIAVPERPGLGIDLDEDVARRYAKPGEPFF